ncbi:MAG: two-component system regulatory protein YycI [Thermoflavifilum sp.]|nr:two-component system regulatory protein YycI [Thermoflavifilum sp.]MCL6513118.1 two-component system regulatory protein YycI [Alicyclobacillus sp.]
MNWERVKTWLIIAFALLDLLLGWQVWLQRQDMLQAATSDQDLLVDTRTLLAERGFVLAADVPGDKPELASLEADPAQPSLTDLAQAMLPGKDAVVADPVQGTIHRRSGMIQRVAVGEWHVTYTQPPAQAAPSGSPPLWQPSLYQPDAALSSRDATVYEEVSGGYPLFDVQATVESQDGRITSITQTAVVNIRPAGAAKPVISAFDALVSLANSVDKPSSGADNTIVKVNLGYVHRMNYWFPVWRVVTHAQVYYINAFTGEVDTVS